MIDYIQNSKILYDDNVLNIESERLYREAEDDFFYFHKEKLAEKKLKAAIKNSPCHIKSIKLLGDIYFAVGKMKKAFNCYSQAAALKPQDSVILASLASVNEILGRYEFALQFVDLAFKYLKMEDIRLFASLSSLKISLLIKLQKYTDAGIFLESAKKRLPLEESGRLAIVGHDILKRKLAIKERMKRLNIQVV